MAKAWRIQIDKIAINFTYGHHFSNFQDKYTKLNIYNVNEKAQDFPKVTMEVLESSHNETSNPMPPWIE